MRYHTLYNTNTQLLRYVVEFEGEFNLDGYVTSNTCGTRAEGGMSKNTTVTFEYTGVELTNILRGFEKSAIIEWQAGVRDKLVPATIVLSAKDYCTGARKQSDEAKFGSLWNRLNEDQRVAMREKYSI